MKSSVLRACILGPYVPLRTSFKRKRVADRLCLSSLFHNFFLVQNDVMPNLYFKNPLTICASASDSVKPSVINFVICSPAILPMAAS